MAKLQYKRLESAVKKFAPMVAEGKTPEEIKTLILAETEESKETPGTMVLKFDEENAVEILDNIYGPDGTGPNLQKNENPENKEETPGKQEESKGEQNAALSGKYIVTQEFRDKDSYSKVIYVGSDVSHFDAERLEHLVKIGYVVKQ